MGECLLSVRLQSPPQNTPLLVGGQIDWEREGNPTPSMGVSVTGGRHAPSWYHVHPVLADVTTD